MHKQPSSLLLLQEDVSKHAKQRAEYLKESKRVAWWLENILSETTFQTFFCFFLLIYFTFPLGGHCVFNRNTTTNRHTRWEAMRVHYDVWTDSCIAKWHVFLRNNQSTHPCRRENISIQKQQTTSRADAHHQIFFSVFLLLSFSWITFYPDSLPWPVLTTCSLEESPCDRTGKISIPLHNAPSDLWVSKLGKKALDTVFRSNQKLLTSQTGKSQGRPSF